MEPRGHEQAPPLRERPWFIALMMFAFFPAGLVMFWRNDAWDWRLKWVVTIVVLGTVVWAVDRLGI